MALAVRPSCRGVGGHQGMGALPPSSAPRAQGQSSWGLASQSWTLFCPHWLRLWFLLKVEVFGAGAALLNRFHLWEMGWAFSILILFLPFPTGPKPPSLVLPHLWGTLVLVRHP